MATNNPRHGYERKRSQIMRAYILGVFATIFFVLPTVAFSQVGVEVGPGGSMSAPGIAITMMAIGVIVTVGEHGVESCGKPASTKRSWASKGRATAEDTGNFAGSAVAPPTRSGGMKSASMPPRRFPPRGRSRRIKPA
jgi:hypothetical protein